MTKNTSLKISSSITDFAPLFLDLEYLFKGLKAADIDGVELVIGIKSRWSVDRIKHLSQKYNLQIASIHQPIWSGLGLYFDEGFFNIAKQLGAKKVVCHPLPKYSLKDKQMDEYFKRLAYMQEVTGVDILVENLPSQYGIKFINYFFPLKEYVNDIQMLQKATQKYNLKLTLDIDHLHVSRPHKESWFKNVLPSIGNIHLSSFTNIQQHLPLYMGDFKAKEFIEYLTKENYQGQLTFEIYYPKSINAFGYDFAPIKKSVDLLRHA